MGYRNPFDIAFNRDGELFTYDSDMEWDVNTPVVSAHARLPRHQRLRVRLSQRLRQVAGLLPSTACPPTVNVGPGSPTGVDLRLRRASSRRSTSEALYLCDWSYGKLYAVHLKPKGSTYTGELEEFVAGTPLPLTDIVVNPKDGAMYFTVGGRKTQSGLYRVTYVGDESTAEPVPAERRRRRGPRPAARARAFHGHARPEGRRRPPGRTSATPTASSARPPGWPSSSQDPATWRERALAETSSPAAALEALLALTHVTAQDPAHRRPGDPAPDPALRDRILAALDRLDWDKLDRGADGSTCCASTRSSSTASAGPTTRPSPG